MHKCLVVVTLVVMVVLVASCAAVKGRQLAQGATFSPPRTGTNYYEPSPYFSGCPRTTWLQADCYTHSGGTVSAQQMLSSDTQWIAQQNLGRFQRVWIMLDQGIRWNADGSYAGLDAQYLANLDDALARFGAQHIQVDAVLLEASAGSSDLNQFKTEALDGAHPALRAGYLAALSDFARHVAAIPADVSTIMVADTLNEAYFQLERFGISDDQIHAFLRDAYQALHAANPALVVTVSDTTRLLKDRAAWEPLYADSTDVYDIHSYSDAPWTEEAFWARAQALSKPWFVGEAGCAPGHVSCTYDGNTSCVQPQTCALSVDSWWIAHLPEYGARAVLIEGEPWTYPAGPDTPALNAVGQLLQRSSG